MDNSVGFLRCLYSLFKCPRASFVLRVGENNHCLATSLPCKLVVARFVDGIVKCRSGLIGLWHWARIDRRVDLGSVDRALEQLLAVSEIGKQIHIGIK